MKKISNNILAALILWLPLVACGSSSLSIDNSSGTASSGDTGTATSDGRDSDGSTITASSPLGDTGNSRGQIIKGALCAGVSPPATNCE